MKPQRRHCRIGFSTPTSRKRGCRNGCPIEKVASPRAKLCTKQKRRECDKGNEKLSQTQQKYLKGANLSDKHDLPGNTSTIAEEAEPSPVQIHSAINGRDVVGPQEHAELSKGQ